MTRVNAVLLVMLVSSCLALVKTSYDARHLFNELDRARTEERRLDEERQRLEAERRAQATNLRVERVAREKLSMRSATPAVTQYVVDAPAGDRP